MEAKLIDLSVQEFARASLSQRLEKLDKQWTLCLKRLDEPAVHDLRVAMRRFGETLRLFKSFVPGNERRQVRDELRPTMKWAGQVRNTDIIRLSFEKAEIELSEAVDLTLQNARAVAEAGLAASLAVGRRTDFASRWRRSLQLDPSAGNHAEENPQSATERVRANLPELLAKYYDEGRALSLKKAAPKKLHDFRLSTKHLRYALESYRPFFGPRIVDLIEVCRKTQSLLGEVSDATATIDCLKALRLLPAAEAQALASHLRRHSEKKATEFGSFWAAQWEKPGTRERWIAYITRYAGRRTPARRTGPQNLATPDSSVSQPVLSV